jgi:hypothetical protein
MIACMSQEPPPLPRSFVPPGPATPAAPMLEYGARGGPDMTVGRYFVHFTAAAMVVGVLLIALFWAGRMRVIFNDFGMKLPLSTRIVLQVSEASRACYGWVLLAAVPFVVPSLLVRLRPKTRRRVATVAILLVLVVLVFTVVALFLPMFAVMQGASGKR